MKKYVLSIFFFFSLLSLFGEDYFRILSAEGSFFTLVRGEIRQDLNVNDTDLEALLLGEGDFLITGEGTFLELSCADIRLMVAGNSALSFDSLNLSQGSLLTLNYGHIRCRMTGSSGSDLWIGGTDTVGRLRGGDVGVLLDYDMTLDQPEILTRIYSLSGRIDVMRKLPETTVGEEKRVEFAAPLSIDTEEMVLASSWDKSSTLSPVFWDSDYARYWQDHPFTGEEEGLSPFVLPPQEEQVLTEDIQEQIEVMEYSDPEWDNLLTTGKAALLLGAASMSCGAVSYMSGYGDLGNFFTGFGLFNLTIGTGVFGYAFLAHAPEE
ncbi:MAG: hypothetical protein PQJ60_05560 [Spirochaetales bacterium]|nr:hypothetical protein [Spirochaetales bacterium]